MNTDQFISIDGHYIEYIICALVIFSNIATIHSQKIYVLENNPNDQSIVSSFDTNDCDTTKVFSSNKFYFSIAFSPNNTLYGLTYNDIYEIDLQSGQETHITNVPYSIAYLETLAADDQYLYMCRNGLVVYDYINDTMAFKGKLPPNMIYRGGLTTYEGDLYKLGGDRGYIVKVNTKDATASKIIDTLPNQSPSQINRFDALEAVQYGCDSTLFYLFSENNIFDDLIYNPETRSFRTVCPQEYDFNAIASRVDDQIYLRDSVTEHICRGDSIQFRGQWYESQGIYLDTVSTSSRCDSIFTLELNVFPPPDFEISGDTVLCQGEVSTLSISDGYDQYAWNNGSTSHSIVVDTAGEYSVTVTDKLGDSLSERVCKGIDSIHVSENPTLDAMISTQDPKCHGESGGEIKIDSVSGGTPSYLLTIDGIPVTEGQLLDGLQPGEHIITIEDSRGCTYRDTAMINEPPDWDIQLEAADTVVQAGNLIQISSGMPSSFIEHYTWAANDSIIDEDQTSMSFRPNSDQWVYYQVIDTNGCSKTDSVFIRVQTRDAIYIPNVFTPNNDGVNDIWEPLYSQGSLQKIQIEIFNRWGNRIFECNGLHCKWNGRFNGKAIPMGVYVYRIRYRLTGKESWEELSGSVTLVK